MFYDLMDNWIAQELGLPVEEYIEKIESKSEEAIEIIVDLVISGNIEQAKELFYDR